MIWDMIMNGVTTGLSSESVISDVELIYAPISMNYVMIQANGDVLLVYGHYVDGERSGQLRWIIKATD